MSVSRTCSAAALTLTVAASLVLLNAPDATAQGCVASRLDAPSGPMNPEGREYYLPAGRWEASLGYRHFRSHRHFVGSIEQDGSPDAVEGDRSSSEVVNHINIPELTLSYGISDRFSTTLDVPIDILHRRNPPRAASATSPARPPSYTDGNGIGDITLMGRYWVGHPAHTTTQNLSVGLGIKLPTGKNDVMGTFWSTSGGTLHTIVHPVDQSIQPGDGGVGIMTEVLAFKSFGSVTAYATGSYLFNPRGTNGVETGRSSPYEAIMSVADQYGARVGLGMPVRAVKGLGLSLGARLEGVPAYDVIGSSEGFRRPGYSIGIEPSISYSWGKSSFSISVPYLIYRNRTQSWADKQRTIDTGNLVHGDAAFADYILIGGFTKRF